MVWLWYTSLNLSPVIGRLGYFNTVVGCLVQVGWDRVLAGRGGRAPCTSRCRGPAPGTEAWNSPPLGLCARYCCPSSPYCPGWVVFFALAVSWCSIPSPRTKLPACAAPPRAWDLSALSDSFPDTRGMSTAPSLLAGYREPTPWPQLLKIWVKPDC